MAGLLSKHADIRGIDTPTTPGTYSRIIRNHGSGPDHRQELVIVVLRDGVLGYWVTGDIFKPMVEDTSEWIES